MGIVLDAVAQLLIYRTGAPGAALLIGPFMIGLPYAVARALTNRMVVAFGREERHDRLAQGVPEGLAEAGRDRGTHHRGGGHPKAMAYATIAGLPVQVAFTPRSCPC